MATLRKTTNQKEKLKDNRKKIPHVYAKPIKTVILIYSVGHNNHRKVILKWTISNTYLMNKISFPNLKNYTVFLWS